MVREQDPLPEAEHSVVEMSSLWSPLRSPIWKDVAGFAKETVGPERNVPSPLFHRITRCARFQSRTIKSSAPSAFRSAATGLSGLTAETGYAVLAPNLPGLVARNTEMPVLS